jgi:hypothetical protein
MPRIAFDHDTYLIDATTQQQELAASAVRHETMSSEHASHAADNGGDFCESLTEEMQ